MVDLINWFLFLRVTVHLKSGERVVFVARKLTRDGEGNDLAALTATEVRGFPFFLRLDDISAITTRRVVRLWGHP